MTDLRELARPNIDAAARFTPALADLQRRAAALRRRRRVLTSVALFGALSVCAGLVLVVSNQPTRLDTAGEGPAADDLALTIQRVEARGGPNGTSEVTVLFNAPLPIDEVPTTDTVESIDPDSLVAAVQDPGPGAVEVCGTKHWFPEVPEGSGSVDLLIPASWLDGDPPALPAVTPLEPAPDKIVLCGPYRGHVQISIWGAAPTSTETLDVTISGDRTRIILRVTRSQNAECVASGDATVIVPDVVGRPLVEAIEQITDDGLAVIGRGVPEGDPSLDTSIVRAQEPPAGELVPEGACVGFRTQGGIDGIEVETPSGWSAEPATNEQGEVLYLRGDSGAELHIVVRPTPSQAPGADEALRVVSAFGDGSAVITEVEGGYALYAALDCPAEPCKRVEVFGYNLSLAEFTELTSSL